MAKEFKLQDPGEGIHEAEILEIPVAEGDHVEEGDIILNIETDKAAVEVPAPFSGVIEQIRVSQGDRVRVGEVLLTYREEDAEEDGGRAEKKPQRARKERAEEKDVEAEEERVEAAKEGQKAKKEAVEPKRPARAARAERREEGPVPASPATRHLARQLGVDLRAVEGSGPGGRVTQDDVRAAEGKRPEKVEERVERPPERRPERPFAPEAPELPDFGRWGETEEVPVRGVRRTTAEHMTLSWSQIPHVTHQDVADISELENFRRQQKEAVAREGGTLSLTILVMKAVVSALKKFPRFNASLDVAGNKLILKRYYHLGIAVDTDQGLVVPVIRDVDRKNIIELAAETVELVDRVRKGKARREDLQGGTFTITNPGPLGGTGFTPIINHPDVAILGMARARLEPVVHEEEGRFTVVPRLRLPLCLAFDHRVNDGADAARFMSSLIDTLSDPESLLLNV